MSFGKDSAPPPPNYQPIADAEQAIAAQQNKLGEEQLAWAKQQYNDQEPLTKAAEESDLASQEQQQGFANTLEQNYINTFQPEEQQVVRDAQDYNTPARRDLNMGQAESAVVQDSDAQRLNAQRQLEGFGINPGSTRYAALDIGSRAMEGAAQAAAGTQASLQTDATGRALTQNAANLAAGMPGQIIGAQAGGVGAGSAGVNAGNSTFATGANAMGSPTSYFGTGQQAIGMQGSLLNAGFSNAMSAAQMNNANSAAMWKGIGGLAGAAVGSWGGGGGGNTTNNYYAAGGMVEGKGENDTGPPPRTDGKLFNDDDYVVIPAIDHAGKRLAPHEAIRQFYQTGIHHGVFSSPEHATLHFCGGGVVGYASGGNVQAIPNSPSSGNDPSGYVPPNASPSGGKQVDDVPARLNAGEFVIPKGTVSWFGEKHFQNMIEKAKKEKAEASAKPAVGPPNGHAAFQHPNYAQPQQAIPTR